MKIVLCYFLKFVYNCIVFVVTRSKDFKDSSIEGTPSSDAATNKNIQFSDLVCFHYIHCFFCWRKKKA